MMDVVGTWDPERTELGRAIVALFLDQGAPLVWEEAWDLVERLLEGERERMRYLSTTLKHETEARLAAEAKVRELLAERDKRRPHYMNTRKED
jgi:hypothetical protein